ncbi:MAG: DUF177 domain-containing protein [Ignavibacteriales bacterium]|nr:DUF177 domain-containing protein [Ignavibacteriales bacterium]
MKIKISNLSIGNHLFQFDGDVSELALSEPFSGNYHVDVSLDKSVHQIIVHLTGEADAKCECNRCSVTFNKKVSFSFNLYYMVDRSLQVDNESDEIRYITPDSDSIDLQSDVYDYANLGIPMKVLCKEDCKGLCTVCGTDLNLSSCTCSQETKAENSPFSQLKNLFNNN